ncbi:hypothetical protein L1887_41799 [Cichorium endivia]|nr:hypothetical protein L1887_41799 [Cichorium endivia]
MYWSHAGEERGFPGSFLKTHSQPEPIRYYSGTRSGLHLYNLVFYEVRVHLRFWSSPSTELTASVLGACKVVFHPKPSKLL